jgi:uncharacterized membrane protein YkoI
MFSTKTIPAALAAVVILGALPAVAVANEHQDSQHQDQAEISALQGAKIGLIDAIRAAEQQVGGKAIDTGIDNQNGNLRYEVKVLKDGAVHNVMVDAQSGQVVAANQGNEDENGPEREHHDDGDQED